MVEQEQTPVPRLRQEVKQTRQEAKRQEVRQEKRAGEQRPQEIRQEIREEIKEAKEGKAEHVLRVQLNEELKRAKAAAQEVRSVVEKTGVVADQVRPEAKQVTKSVVRILEGIKEGIVTPPEKSKAIFKKLAEKGITDAVAAYLHQILEKYLEKEASFSKAGEDETEFEKDIKSLAARSPKAAELLLSSVVEAAETVGLTKEQAEKKLEEVGRELVAKETEAGRQAEFDKFWGDFGERYYGGEREKLELLKAVFIPSEFTKHVEERQREKAREMGINLDDILRKIEEIDRLPESQRREKREERGRLEKQLESLNIKLSEEIKDDIALLYGELLTGLDESESDAPFEEIVRQDFWRGIEVAYIALSTAVRQLAHYFERRGIEEFAGLTFYKRVAGKYEGEREIPIERDSEGNVTKTTTKPDIRLRAEYKPTKTTLSEFINSAGLVGDHDYNTRRYTHNVIALFLRQPEEGKGFYGGLANYAEQMKTSDVDEMMLLPDSHIVLHAHQIYIKTLLKTFAKADWIHHPDFFQKQPEAVRTEIEEQVLQTLKKLYPDYGKEKEWRLRRAFRMAIGMSRGVFLSDPEVAAYADPALNPNGSPTYESYYVADPEPLKALNPLHHYYRWQSEGSLQGPILFIPTSGLEGKFGTHDHSEYFERMEKYRRTFLEGNEILTEKDEKLFIDLLMNVAGVGSFATRSGWRLPPSYEGWFIDKDAQGKETALSFEQENYLKMWRRIENIGYEALKNFLKSYEGHGLLGEIERKMVKEGWKPLADRNMRQFLQGLFESYIKPAGVKKSLDSYIGETADYKSYEAFFNRVLAGVVAHRFPSKFVTIERDRFTPDGKRAWEKIKEKSGLDVSLFDRAMEHISIAETLLRQEISERMDAALVEGKPLEEADLTFTLQGKTIEGYRLTEEAIDALLRSKRFDETDIGRAKEVFNKIKQEYIENDTFLKKFTKEYIKGNKYPFALGIEEFDARFVAFRGGGPRILPRSLKDTAALEMNVVHEIQNFLGVLRTAAIDGKKDFSPIVQSLARVKGTLENVHSPEFGQRVAFYMSGMAINYFKKDTLTKGLMSPFGLGRMNSLAARFAGRSTAVWEWTTADIDTFITHVETHRVLPKQSIDLNVRPEDAKYVTKHFLGIPYKVRQDYEYFAGKLRREFGADVKHIAAEILATYTPLLIAFLLYKYISDALKETEGKKQ